MAKTPGEKRAAGMMVIQSAVKKGLTQAETLRQLASKGITYRRTTMLADFRSYAGIKEKTGLLKYVRKGFQPSPKLYAETEWNLSREYFYKIKVQTRIRPGEPIESRFINIVTDNPLTPGEWEAQIAKLWATKYRGVVEAVVKIEPVLAMKRAPS